MDGSTENLPPAGHRQPNAEELKLILRDGKASASVVKWLAEFYLQNSCGDAWQQYIKQLHGRR